MLVRYSHDKNGRTVKKAVIYTQSDHKIDRRMIDGDVMRIIQKLRNFGYDAYLVGGAVRDLMIGKKPKDFDVVTSADPVRIRKIFRNSRIIGRRFRLVHIFYPDKIFEVSTFRSIKNGTVGNVFGVMDEDVMRRDFTINALYYDPEKQQIIDYTGGVRDLQAKKLVSVIPVKVIFREDPVRMIRALKYSVSSGCRISFSLRRELRKSAPLLKTVSPSRLTEEIIKIVNSGNACGILREAVAYDLFLYLQGGAADLMDGCPDFPEMYEKSLRALDESVAAGQGGRLGDRLVFLIRDFVRMIADWKGNPAEVYRTVYGECRRFILPMNPPRVELEYAVAACLAQGGMAAGQRKRRRSPSVPSGGKGARKGSAVAETSGAKMPYRRKSGGEMPQTAVRNG